MDRMDRASVQTKYFNPWRRRVKKCARREIVAPTVFIWKRIDDKNIETWISRERRYSMCNNFYLVERVDSPLIRRKIRFASIRNHFPFLIKINNVRRDLVWNSPPEVERSKRLERSSDIWREPDDERQWPLGVVLAGSIQPREKEWSNVSSLVFFWISSFDFQTLVKLPPSNEIGGTKTEQARKGEDLLVCAPSWISYFNFQS